MDIIYHPVVLSHDTGNNPESASRITCLGELPVTDLIPHEQDLSLVHTRDYIQKVKQFSASQTPLDADTMLSSGSFDAALYSVAATIRASETGGFAVVRPPGHHAYPDHGSGFCIFNSVAIAVQRLVAGGKRVLIFDFDGHLGDGTEQIFYSSDSVLYCSLHQFPAFPQKGTVDEIGADTGKGFTVNIPLPPKSGDDLFLSAVGRVLPVITQFHPDIVAVSAGFDGHHSDPLLELNLSATAYYEIGSVLRSHFPTIFATLEGGYNTSYLPKCLYNFLDGINGNPQKFAEDKTESPILTLESFEVTMDTLMRNLQPYWNVQL